MSEDTDLMKLYSTRILALATDIPQTARLENPQATVKKRAPLCGSNVTVDLDVADGRVTGFGQDVKACALGQAAAAVVGRNVIGRSLDELRHARSELRDMLKEDRPAPSAPFDDLEVLLPARGYANRHASILLSLDATIEAFEEIVADNTDIPA